jgi:hypothetical protein
MHILVHFQNVRIPNADGQRSMARDIATRDVNSLPFQTPSPEVPISRLDATWTPLTPGVPRCHVTFGISRIANPQCKFPFCRKPRMPNPDSPTPRDRAPPVLTLIDGSRKIGKSLLAISKDKLLPCQPPNADMRWLASLRTCELTPSQLLLDLMVDGNSRFFTAISSHRFSSS